MGYIRNEEVRLPRDRLPFSYYTSVLVDCCTTIILCFYDKK